VLFFFLSPTLRCFGGFSGSFLPYQEELCVGRLRSAKQTIGRLMEKKDDVDDLSDRLVASV
jgi:hypothetical protein